MQIDRTSKESGFTIIELMISTLIFSVLMVVIAQGITTFSASYYKGITASKTQQIARSTADSIVQAIQFGGAAPYQPAGVSGWCIGATRFDYVHNQKVGGTDHALWRSPVGAGGCAGAVGYNAAGGSKELLADRMRLVKLAITPAPNSSWNVSLRVAYGDDDLLCSPAQGNCNNNDPTNFAAAYDLQCRGGSGTQYCAVSELDTVVQERVQ